MNNEVKTLVAGMSELFSDLTRRKLEFAYCTENKAVYVTKNHTVSVNLQISEDNKSVKFYGLSSVEDSDVDLGVSKIANSIAESNFSVAKDELKTIADQYISVKLAKSRIKESFVKKSEMLSGVVGQDGLRVFGEIAFNIDNACERLTGVRPCNEHGVYLCVKPRKGIKIESVDGALEITVSSNANIYPASIRAKRAGIYSEIIKTVNECIGDFHVSPGAAACIARAVEAYKMKDKVKFFESVSQIATEFPQLGYMRLEDVKNLISETYFKSRLEIPSCSEMFAKNVISAIYKSNPEIQSQLIECFKLVKLGLNINENVTGEEVKDEIWKEKDSAVDDMKQCVDDVKSAVSTLIQTLDGDENAEAPEDGDKESEDYDYTLEKLYDFDDKLSNIVDENGNVDVECLVKICTELVKMCCDESEDDDIVVQATSEDEVNEESDGELADDSTEKEGEEGKEKEESEIKESDNTEAEVTEPDENAAGDEKLPPEVDEFIDYSEIDTESVYRVLDLLGGWKAFTTCATSKDKECLDKLGLKDKRIARQMIYKYTRFVQPKELNEEGEDSGDSEGADGGSEADATTEEM